MLQFLLLVRMFVEVQLNLGTTAKKDGEVQPKIFGPYYSNAGLAAFFSDCLLQRDKVLVRKLVDGNALNQLAK